MSTTQMLTSNALAVKLWAKDGWLNIGQQTAFGHIMDRGGVHFASELLGSRQKGDNLTYSYTNKLTGIPVGEGGTLVGNTEALNLGNFQIAMNVTRIGVESPNDDTIEQQRTYVEFQEQARRQIEARHAELIDTSVFYQLAGANPTSFTLNGTTWSGTNRLFVQGHNTPTAPSADKIVRAGGAATDEALTSSNTMSLTLIDYALEQNELSDQPIKPFDDGTFDVYLSPEQTTDLMHDTTSAIQWYNNQLAALTGGYENMLMGGSYNKGKMVKVGQYGRVNIYTASRVAYGVNSSTSAVISTVRRGVLVGKDALTFASPFGGRLRDSDVPLKYFQELVDVEYYRIAEGRLIYGLKKTAPSNGDDVGVIVLSTYAQSHG